MDAWSNISISSKDPEIVKINELEARLGKIPDHVYKIRELITRLEVCHFKYQQHIKKIRDSIISFAPVVVPDKIGINHIQHGENAWKNDSTGKSLPGQQYVWAIKNWLDDNHSKEISAKYDKKLGQKVHKWLGDKNVDKMRLAKKVKLRLGYLHV